MIGPVEGVRVGDIMRAVAEFYGLEKRDLARRCREVRFIRARQVAMYLTRKMTAKSEQAIGRLFERDHTTVHHAVQRVGDLLVREPQLVQQVRSIIEKICTSDDVQRWDLSEKIVDEVLDELRPVLLREMPAGRPQVLKHLGAIAAQEEGRSA